MANIKYEIVAEVTVLADVNSNQDDVAYMVSSIEECRDETARQAYEMCCRLDDVITMGKTIVCPRNQVNR